MTTEQIDGLLYPIDDRNYPSAIAHAANRRGIISRVATKYFGRDTIAPVAEHVIECASQSEAEALASEITAEGLDVRPESSPGGKYWCVRLG